MHSVPTAGASGRSLTIALSKGYWGNPRWRSPTDGKLWWDSHWGGQSRGYSLFAKSSVAGFSAQVMISIASVAWHWWYLSLGEKQVLILRITLSSGDPNTTCFLGLLFHSAHGESLIWSNYFRSENAFMKLREWWSLVPWNLPGGRRPWMLLLFPNIQVAKEDGELLNRIKKIKHKLEANFSSAAPPTCLFCFEVLALGEGSARHNSLLQSHDRRPRTLCWH